MPDVRVIQVQDAFLGKRFLETPYLMQGGDPCWIPPLRASQRKLLRGRTAFFGHGEIAPFIALIDNVPVGRVAAIRYDAHNDHYNDHTGFFGFFECVHDPKVAIALVEAAAAWLRERGLETIRGPVNPSMQAECGLLIDGFDSAPMVLMPHSPPYYGELLEASGLRKCKDLFAYRFERKDFAPGSRAYSRVHWLAQRAEEMLPAVKLRSIRRSRFDEDFTAMMESFDDARRDNWGYVPATAAEKREARRLLRPVIDPDLIVLAELDSRIIAVLFGLPDLNQLLEGSNGHLSARVLLKLMRIRHYVTRARVVGMSVLTEYRHTGVLARLFLDGLLRVLSGNYQTFEASWILEDNAASTQTIERLLKIDPYKVYRIYEKPLTQSSRAAR